MSQLPEFSSPAGAAFLLSEPAPRSIAVDHPEGRVIIREGAANISVNLLNSHSVGDVKSVAWRVIQESLDLLAAKKCATLSTELGDWQYVFWSQLGKQYDLICVITFTSKWSINAQESEGGPRPVKLQQTLAPHNSLRFYRMSQCAWGLFDAYRNAYLALECLVSEVAPKRPGELELDWLTRVVGGQLAQAVPSSLNIKDTLEEIYRYGRNPLFHAKIEETFYPPHGPQTEDVQVLFERLTLLLVSLLQYKFGKDVVGRWATMSQAVQDAQTRVTLDFDEMRFDHGTEEVSVTPTIEVINSPQRFGQLWAKVIVVRPEGLLSMRKVRFLRRGQSWMQFELQEAVDMSKVSRVTFEVNFINQNQYAPRAFHPE
jgi:hypothetical protein